MFAASISRMYPLTLSMWLFAGHLLGQTIPPPRPIPTRWNAEAGLQWGALAAHRSEMWRVVTGHAWGAHLSVGRHLVGGWTQTGRRPWAWQGFGVDATYGGSPELGWQVSALWLNRLPLSDRWNAEWGLGMGLTTRPYDPVTSPSSFVLGSRWNAALRWGLHRPWHLPGPLGTLHTTLGLTHLSNGSTRQPNLGTNTLALQLGWSPPALLAPPRSTIPSTIPSPDPPAPVPPWDFALALRAGYRDLDLPGGVHYPLTGLGLHAAWAPPPLRASSHPRATARLRPALGFTLTYNTSLRFFHESSRLQFPNAPDPTGSTPGMRLQPAALAGFHWQVGATRIAILQGWILAHPDPILGTRHLHTAISHPIHPHWRVELGLRSYQVRAEHPFLGIQFTP